MEADSTTFDNSSKNTNNGESLPFTIFPGNLLLYRELTSKSEEKSLEWQIVEKLQRFGLIPSNVRCPSAKEDCKIICKAARVIDKVQWVCEGCSKRLPIRTGSFFLRIQCSILQVLQMILAWSEDAGYETAAQHFGVKPRVASTIYDKLDELAIKEQKKRKLGGNGSVVLTEMYPDCLTRLSPDTTDHPHVHRVLMVADTKHVPTRYQLHVIRENLKKISGTIDDRAHAKEIQETLSRVTEPDSILITGSNIPLIEGVNSIQQLVQYSDVDMQHFLTNRIWRQAMSLCVASRDLCVGTVSMLCADAVQRYLHTSLYRLHHSDGFYRHMLQLLANEYTEEYHQVTC